MSNKHQEKIYNIVYIIKFLFIQSVRANIKLKPKNRKQNSKATIIEGSELDSYIIMDWKKPMACITDNIYPAMQRMSNLSLT